MILAIYDLSGIQSFIFAGNKLKEMIGASLLVHNALFKNIPELVYENPDKWTEKSNPFVFNANNTNGQIVYIGGGNALMAFSNETTYKLFTRDLQKKVFEQTGGALRLCHGMIDTEEETHAACSLAKIMKALYEELEDNKQSTPSITTAKGFSLNTHDNVTFEPVVLVAKNRYAPRSTYLKLEKRQEEIKTKESFFQHKDLKFINKYDEFQEKDTKNFLAVIHIDGNGMGTGIQNFIEGLDSNQGLVANLNELRRLSAEINKAYTDALHETMDRVPWRVNKNDEVFFRPIILDGDDFTCICASENAFQLVKAFMDNLLKKEITGLTDKNGSLSAAAGIAFVKYHFPFHTAYDIAEQCCQNAKKTTKERLPSTHSTHSSVDFQVFASGVTESISSFRNDNYIFRSANGTLQLHIRPYVFGGVQETSLGDSESDIVSSIPSDDHGSGIDQSIPSDDCECGAEKSIPFYDYEHRFEENLAFLRKIAEDSRSKLKDLKAAYGQGLVATKQYTKFLEARLIRSKAYTQSSTISRLIETTIKDEDKYDDDYLYANFFDVLDVMDLLEEGE